MRILFFTPFSLRNGAEMMLWYIIKNIDRSKFHVAVFSLSDGVLLQELPADVPCYLPQPVTIKRRLFRKANFFLGKPEIDFLTEDIENAHKAFAPDIWYLNTLLCHPVATLAEQRGIPFVVHFHELSILYQLVPYEAMQRLIQKAEFVIGCAEVVCGKLRMMGAKDVRLQYECIDLSIIQPEVESVAILKQATVTSEQSFVWVMSGSMEYRKGTDLICEIARTLGDKITILWLGPGSSGFTYFIECELAYYNLQNVKILGGKTSDYYDYLSLADGLLLTSREDPFPLVMLEAGYLGKPIVSFQSGGVAEFVKSDTGIVIDSNNVSDLITAMKNVMDGTFPFQKENAIQRAKEFDTKKQVLHWQEIMFDRHL